MKNKILIFLFIILIGIIPITVKAQLAESDHPYANNFAYTWPAITEHGATQMRLHFTKIELANCDTIKILDKDGNQLLKYGGCGGNTYFKEDVWTEWFTVDTLKIRLETNNQETAWGLQIDALETRSSPTNSSGLLNSSQLEELFNRLSTEQKSDAKISLYLEPRTGQIINQLELNVHSLDLNLFNITPDNIELNYTFQGKTGNTTFNLSNDSYIWIPITVDLNQRNDFPFEDYNTTIYISTKDKNFTNNFFLNISNENTTIDSWGQARRLNFHYEGNKIEITMERVNKQISEWLYFLGLAIIFSYLICFWIIYWKSPYTSDMFAVFNSFSFLFFVALVIAGIRDYLFISIWGQLFLVLIIVCFASFVFKRFDSKNQHNISELKKEQEISEFKKMLKQNNEEIIEIKEMLKARLKHDEERLKLNENRLRKNITLLNKIGKLLRGRTR